MKKQNKDSVRITWHIDDIQNVRPYLSTNEARHVLASVRDNHDAAIGINWEVISACADSLYPKEEPIQKYIVYGELTESYSIVVEASSKHDAQDNAAGIALHKWGAQHPKDFHIYDAEIAE